MILQVQYVLVLATMLCLGHASEHLHTQDGSRCSDDGKDWIEPSFMPWLVCTLSHFAFCLDCFCFLQWITATSVESKCLQALHVGVIQGTTHVADTIAANIYRRIKSVHNGVIQGTTHVADTIAANIYRRIKSVHNDSAESKLSMSLPS